MGKNVDDFDAAFEKINKLYEPGTIGKLGSMPQQDIERIESGSMALDIALGGGYPRGRVVEIFGAESSGKTTLAIEAIAKVQKAGGRAGILDLEQAFDKEYAANVGVDVDSLIFSQAETAEQAWEILEILVDTGKLDLLVVDSVASMTPKREMEGDMGDAVVGLQARLMSQGFRKNVARIKRNNTTIIFINQTRQKVGVVYGSPETTPGGMALKFYASQRLRVRKAEAVKQGDEVIAHKTEVKVIKNKVSAPHKAALFNISFGKGINKTLEILDAATEFDIVQKSGSWYSYNGEKLGQGLIKVIDVLEDNPDILDAIEFQMLEKIDELKG
jgi:recombination protein RecA